MSRSQPSRSASNRTGSADAALRGVIAPFTREGDVGYEPVEIGYVGSDRQTRTVSQDGKRTQDRGVAGETYDAHIVEAARQLLERSWPPQGR